MANRSNNPFVTKKSILNLMKKKKNKTLPIAKPKIPKKDKEVVEETSVYTRPGEPYNVIATVISCTPVIPVMYKIYATTALDCVRDSDLRLSYADMYKLYNTIKERICIYSQYINIITGVRVEIDNTDKDRVITIKKALDRFISDWSAYYWEDHNHYVSISHKYRDDDIEEIDLLVYGSLEFYHYYFNTLFDGINSIGNEILRAIASSNLIYRDIILDEESVAGAKMTIRSMFMDPDIQSKIDAEQYDSSELKNYVDSFYNSTIENYFIRIIYIDDINLIEKNIKNFFGENYDILFDTINHIYGMINILAYVKSYGTKKEEKLNEFLSMWFNPQQTDENRENNVFLNTIKKSLEDHFDFKIDMFSKYSFYPSYRETASYDDVDEVVEEQEIL